MRVSGGRGVVRGLGEKVISGWNLVGRFEERREVRFLDGGGFFLVLFFVVCEEGKSEAKRS